MILPTTKTIARLPHLTSFLADSPNAIAGWGRKPSGQRAAWLAKALRRPLALLEDGFIRSTERDAQTLSLIVDDIGVYYDATRPSGMERAIDQDISAAQAMRARNLAEMWCGGRISKYNHAAEYACPLPDQYVLVADQTRGDLSISAGLASAKSFSDMLSAAIHENTQSVILVKIHPDVYARAKQGNLLASELAHPRVRIIGSDCHCAELIRRSLAVYCVTSLIGFEALLWKRPVRCFGMPFYAGWGLTSDALPRPLRRRDAQIENIVHAALVDLARYVDPRDGTPWGAEQAIRYVANYRRKIFGPGSREDSTFLVLP